MSSKTQNQKKSNSIVLDETTYRVSTAGKIHINKLQLKTSPEPKKRGRKKAVSMKLDSPVAEKIKPVSSPQVTNPPVSVSSHSDLGIRRSGRKRKLKQFLDYEVELPQERHGEPAAGGDTVDHSGSIEPKHKVKREAADDEMESDRVFSETKPKLKQSYKDLREKISGQNETSPASAVRKAKRRTNTASPVQVEPGKGQRNTGVNKVDCFIDLSPSLKQLGKTGGILYKCVTEGCSEMFFSLKRLDVHKKVLHSETVRHLCTNCGKDFGTFFMYRSHIRMEHSNIETLPFIIRNVEIVIKDEKNLVGREISVCTKCGYRYGQLEDRDHVCEPMELRYYCPCCEFESFADVNMQDHLSENHRGEFHESKHIERYVDLRSSAKEPGWSIDPNDRSCEICNINFETYEGVKQHMNAKHANHPFACGLCKLCYGRKTALKKHMMTHRKTDLKCDVCMREFYEKSRLAVHMLTHTGERPHQCEICGNRYCDERAVRKHILTKHTDHTPKPRALQRTERKLSKTQTESVAICHQCGKSFNNVLLLNKHMKIHRKTETYKCPDCYLTFHEISTLKQHKLSHKTLDFTGTGNIKTLSNQTLHEVFKEIKVFEEGHPSGKPYKCGICDKRFDKQHFVHRHIRVIHMKEEDKSFVCGICKRGFTLSAALRTHMRLHSNIKPYKCRLCNKQFRQVGHIKDHLLHHGKAQLQCSICKRMFKSRGSLRRHVRVHCKINPFKCPVNDCVAAFQSLFPFLEHLSSCLVSVNVSSLLQCNFCQELFTKGDIASHFHSHENDLKFHCETCGMSFGNYQSLYFHKEKKTHFLESEFETPGNNNVMTRMASQDIGVKWTNEELMSQYDYIEEDEDSAIAADKIKQENNDTTLYVEESKMDGTVDNDGELILIAEQLTYMASGFPYREVIVQTTENDGDGTITEITIEDVEDGQIVEQVADGQTIEEVIAGQHVEQVSVEQSGEQVDQQQLLQQIFVGQKDDQVDTEQKLEQVIVVGQYTDQVDSSQMTIQDSFEQTGENIREHIQFQQPIEEVSPDNLNGGSSSEEQNEVLKEKETTSEVTTVVSGIQEPAESEKFDSSVVSADQGESQNFKSETTDDLQTDSNDELKPEQNIDKMCPVCKCSFPDDVGLTEHFCVESSVSDIESGESEYETETKVNRAKQKIRVSKRSKKSIMSNSISRKLCDWFKKGNVEYECATAACSKLFNNINKLSLHKKQVHSEILKYVCDLCEKHFGTFFIYKSHIRMEHNTKPCVKYQVKNTNIDIIEKNNSLGRAISVCTKCGYRYGELEDPKHDCGPAQLRYYCPCCSYASEDLSQIEKHIFDAHAGKFKMVDTMDRYAYMRSANREPGWLISEGATKCDACSLTFRTNNALKQHLNTKHAAHPFACGICKTCYGRKSALMKHMASHKNLDLKCEVCQKEFSQKSRLDVHKMIHTGEKPHPCEVCGRRYCDDKTVRKHMMLKHVKEFKQRYPNIVVNNHVKKRTSIKTPTICHCCGKTFPTNSQLKRHLKEHKKEDMFKCPSCELTFDDIVALKKHKLTHQTLELSGAGNLKGLSNSDMHEVFKELKVYEEGHPSGKPYKCGICDMRFKKQQFVQRHIRVIHMKEEDKSFVCGICKRGFTLNAALRTHMRLHSNVKPYKCRLCNKQFRQVGHIKDHLLHHGKAQMQCTLCKKMYKSKGNLRRHVQMHCKILPYKCPVNGCTAAFHSLHPFLTHSSDCLESVAPKATLLCNFCNKPFPSSEILSHYHSHEKHVEFPCQVCGMSFHNYQRLFFHKDEKKHFVESEFENASNPVEKDVPDRSDIPVGDSDGKPDWSMEDLMLQYDYIMEEDCIMPAQVNSEENIDNGDVLEEVVENNDTDIQVQQEVAEIIANQLNQGEILLTSDQLSDLTSGVVYSEVIVQTDQTEELSQVTEVPDKEGIFTQSDISTAQELISSVGTSSEVYTVTKPSDTEEVTYYILTLDQPAT